MPPLVELRFFPRWMLLAAVITTGLLAASPARAERAKNYSNEQLKLLFSGTKVEATGGFLGLGNRISPDEQRVLDELDKAFAR